MPNLMVDGREDALKKVDAPVFYVLNIMTQEGETEGYTAFDHLQELIAHAGSNIFDICIYNTQSVPQKYIDSYAKETAIPVVIDKEKFDKAKIEIVGYPLVSNNSVFARHDENKLAYAILSEYVTRFPRMGEYACYDNLLIKQIDKAMAEGS